MFKKESIWLGRRVHMLWYVHGEGTGTETDITQVCPENVAQKAGEYSTPLFGNLRRTVTV